MAATIPPGANLSKIPLAQNPNGSPPNFANAPSQSSTDLAVGLPFAILSTCFVFLRLITNFRHTRKLGMDDCACLIASQDINWETSSHRRSLVFRARHDDRVLCVSCGL